MNTFRKVDVLPKKLRTVADLPQEISKNNVLERLADVEIPSALKQAVKPDHFEYRTFDATEYWRKIPSFKEIDYETFIDVKFQNKFTVTSLKKLKAVLGDIVSEEFLADVDRGMELAPMNVRLSPYLISRINWSDPYNDPLRIQFLPVASSRLKDHPKLSLDSLHEQDDSPVQGLVHRYPDKVLFLPLDVCPVYCRFCTRSYAIGGDTDTVDKVKYKPIPKNWEKAFAYIASRPEIEDVVISGGDAFHLSAVRIREIGETLLEIPHIRRIRFASKGMAVLPMKVLTDQDWVDSLIYVNELGRKKFKEVCLHTHFNHPNEMSAITEQAMRKLFEHGIKVRNQSVLIRGVNDDKDIMTELVKKLSYINIQPYYVYQHDMVQGVEDLRTTVAETVEIEKHVRGATAGFNTPVFVNDAPGGGGKRDVHSYEYYNPVTGISVYRSPNVDDEKLYFYYDPIDKLPKEGQKLWEDKEGYIDLINDVRREVS